jgi:2,3-bisphosphoglycerate-dependent phosphoglycerate mutase
MPETHLHLIRHAQAVVNVTGTIGGPEGDTGLTDLGITQAEKLRNRLAQEQLVADVLLASTLPRAKQTAEIIAPAFGLPILFDEELEELRSGPEADGMLLNDYIARFGWIDIRTHPFHPVNAGGESLAMFHLRVCATLDKICREHAGKTIVCVTHGGVVDTSFVHFFGLGLHQMPHVQLHTHNASLTHWAHLTHDDQPPFWRLESFNDRHHLR